MKKAILAALLTSSNLSYAQSPPAKAEDAWTNVPSARDDRYTNPKSALYAGPNGWFNFGEVRGSLANAAKTAYQYQGGFQLTTHTFTAVGTNRLHVLSLDFDSDKPAPGSYEASAKANPATKKVKVGFADVSGQKIRNWSSADKAGVVTVSEVNGFTYLKFRGIVLQPDGIHNVGDLKVPMTVGFEGAVAPER